MIPVDTDQELLRLWNSDNVQSFYKLTAVRSGFHDLRVLHDDKGRPYWCSAEANPEVDSMEIRGIDRQFNAAPLVVWTYITLPEGRLYSDPPCHHVANAVEWGFGEQPLPDWEQGLRDSNVNPELIARIREYLQARPPISYR